jgi:hypothetical protein
MSSYGVSLDGSDLSTPSLSLTVLNKHGSTGTQGMKKKWPVGILRNPMENILSTFSRDFQVYETLAPVPNLPHKEGACHPATCQLKSILNFNIHLLFSHFPVTEAGRVYKTCWNHDELYLLSYHRPAIYRSSLAFLNQGS